MALGFLKRVFSFGKDDKSAVTPEPDVAPIDERVKDQSVEPSEEPIIDPVTAEHLGDRLIVPDSLHPDDLDETAVDPADELREQAESVAEFNEAVEEEPTADGILSDEPGIEVDEQPQAAEPTAEAWPAPESAAEIESPVGARPALEPEPRSDEVADVEPSPDEPVELTVSQIALESRPLPETDDVPASEPVALQGPEPAPVSE